MLSGCVVIFLKMDVTERWSVAKRYNLCFRCLGEGHRGKICLRSRTCGLNGCIEVQNRLLHSYDIGKQEWQIRHKSLYRQ